MKDSMQMPKKAKESKSSKGLHHVGLDTVLPGKRKDGMVSGKFGSLPKGKNCR